mgnify:FL=1
MNTANKITISRVIMSFIIMILLLFPFELLNIKLPTYIFNGNIYIELKYIIAGILFVIASLTDFFDGYIARKYNMVTDFGKMVDAVSDKLLTNTVLVILACDGMVSPVIAVVIIARDIFVDSIKMVMGNKGKAVAAIKVAKFKTASLMVGIILTLFYNIPFELINLRVSDFMLVLAAILSVISGVKYYMMARVYFTDK